MRSRWVAVYTSATIALGCRGVDADCPRTTTALTSRCEDTCYLGRPCLAMADGADIECSDSQLNTCKINNESQCRYSCFKYGLDDFVENNLIEYSAFTFLIPFGSTKSRWEVNWDVDETEEASAARFDNETDEFPSTTNNVLQVIEPLSFLSSTRSVTIAGGTSTDGIRGRVATVKMSPGIFDEQSQLQSITLANLGLEQIPASSFPPQLVNLTLTNCVMNSYPEDLTTMTVLEHLVLSKNYFKSYPTKFALATLRVLDMSKNSLESFDGVFANLEQLDLSDNVLTSVPPAIFSMPKLQSLNLTKNAFVDVSLTRDQYEFLSKIPQLVVDSFGSPACSNDTKKGLAGTTVCVENEDSEATDGSSSGNSNSNTAAIIGGIVGGVGVIAIVAAFIIVRRRRHTHDDKTSRTITVGGVGSTQAGSVQESGRSLWNDQDLLSLQLNPDDIEDVRKIGTGAFSVVYLVKYRKSRWAASKRLKRDEIDWKNTQHFISEIKLHSTLDHPRIVSLIGVAWTIESDLQALFEFMERGDLRSYLEDPSTSRTWSNEKAQIAIDVIEALVYVHSFVPPLVHRDLKSRNILLGGGLRAKLSDFGVARFRSDVGTMTTGVGTGRWLAPEVIAGASDYDEACDIFAFGVVLSEMDTHELPYENVCGPSGNRLADVALLQMVATGKLVPSFSRDCPDSILQLAMRCVAFDPLNRPSAVEVAYALRTMHHHQL